MDDPSSRTELRLVLTAAINELPADYRTALVLQDIEGLSNREIGDVLRISVAGVKARVHRARAARRKPLAPQVSAPHIVDCVA